MRLLSPFLRLLSVAALFGAAQGTTLFFDFEHPEGTTQVGGGTSLVGNSNFTPAVRSGRLHLTTTSMSNNSAFHIPAIPDSEIGFMVSFDYEVADPIARPPPADGFSFNYGDFGFGSLSLLAEEGFPGASNNLSWEFDTWLTDDPGPAIGLNRPANIAALGGSLHASSLAYTNGQMLLEGDTISGSIQIVLTSEGVTTFTSTGAITNANFVELPTGFTLDNSYSFALAARTGGASQNLFIDNLSLQTIPEPSGIGLLGLGLGSLLLRRRK